MMKSTDHEPRQADKAISQQHVGRAASGSNSDSDIDRSDRPNPAGSKPQQDQQSAKSAEEKELGPGSELDAVPPDANREPVPPDASIPKRSQ